LKVITLNLKGYVRLGGFLFKLFALVTVFALFIGASGKIFEKSELHIEALNDITDKKTIIIDAGHGGEDCGAIGANGVYEKDLNLTVAMTLGEMLTNEGYAVVYTRTEDKLLYKEEENVHGIRKISDLKNRCKIAAEYEGAILISIHMNSFGDARYSGLHTYYSENGNSSYELAGAIQDAVKVKLQPNNNRVIKAGRGMYVLENVKNTAVLIECGFLSNPDECEKLSQKEYQRELCFSILCGIIEYTENKA